MKQQRRHELKTNDLSVYLQEMYEGAKRNSRYIVGGLAVVVVVLVISLVTQRNRRAVQLAAWAEHDRIVAGDLASDPTLLEDVRQLAGQYADDKQLGPSVLSLQGNVLYMSTMDMTGRDQTADRIERLKQSRDAYNDLIQRYGSRPLVQGKSKIMLAKIEESLIVEGEGDVEKVRAIYQELIDSKSGAYATQAEARLASLDERLTPLTINEAPTTATAPAEGTTTAPAAEPPTTVPASAPTSAPATAPAS